MNRAICFAALFFLLVISSGCDQSSSGNRKVELFGHTMGTTWSIRIVSVANTVEIESLQTDIERLLKDINQSMSTYDAESELSRFNKSKGTDWFAVSPPLLTVIKAAQQISTDTRGAFDISSGTLVNLWGFGPNLLEQDFPDDASISHGLEQTGYQKLHIRDTPPAIRKDFPDLYIDLSAIAKGYAVDRIAEYLDSAGLRDYLVEIGGELRGSGNNAMGVPWQVAVEKPAEALQQIQQIIRLDDMSVATSGNYRNYFEHNGRRYSHVIEPATGYPVSHDTVSVVVVTDVCMQADALATALLVMGEEKGLDWAEQRGLAVLFIKGEQNRLNEVTTSGFADLVIH